MRFTLVIATMGRTSQLENFFTSLAEQEYAGVDCVLVDQNPDDRLVPIVARWQREFPILHIRTTPGVSRARNIGLLHATGDIVAFPDDDCWYTPALLKSVKTWFVQHAEFDILTVGAVDRTGIASGNRWLQSSCEIRPHNVFRTTFCSSIFLRRGEDFTSFRFDEKIGPGSGSPFGCGEETDYILQRLAAGERGHFTRALSVGHPVRDMLSGTVDAKRAFDYGCGMGYVLRKRSLPLLTSAFLLYDLVRAVTMVICGRFSAAKLCFKHAAGIAAGFISARNSVPAPNLPAIAAQ